MNEVRRFRQNSTRAFCKDFNRTMGKSTGKESGRGMVSTRAGRRNGRNSMGNTKWAQQNGQDVWAKVWANIGAGLNGQNGDVWMFRLEGGRDVLAGGLGWICGQSDTGKVCPTPNIFSNVVFQVVFQIHLFKYSASKSWRQKSAVKKSSPEKCRQNFGVKLLPSIFRRHKVNPPVLPVWICPNI